jgi:hypothetical protein
LKNRAHVDTRVDEFENLKETHDADYRDC